MFTSLMATDGSTILLNAAAQGLVLFGGKFET